MDCKNCLTTYMPYVPLNEDPTTTERVTLGDVFGKDATQTMLTFVEPARFAQCCSVAPSALDPRCCSSALPLSLIKLVRAHPRRESLSPILESAVLTGCTLSALQFGGDRCLLWRMDSVFKFAGGSLG